MKGERHDFGETMPKHGSRNSLNAATGHPEQGWFLSKRELSLPRSTARIVGIVVLVPLLALIVWASLDVIKSRQSEMAPESVYNRPTAVAFVAQCWSQPQGEVVT